MKKILITILTLSAFLFLGYDLSHAELDLEKLSVSEKVSRRGNDTVIQIDSETVLVLEDYNGVYGKDFGIVKDPQLSESLLRVPNSMASSTTLWYAYNNYPRSVYTEKSKSFQQGSGGYKVYVYRGTMHLKSVQTAGTRGGYSVHYNGTLYR